MENLIAWILMAAISLPVSFLVARGCLRGVMRLMSGGTATRCVMIAGVKGSAVLSALLILLPWDARAADDMAGAIRELARKTVALAGRGEPVSVNWRNLSSLPSGDFNRARIAFDAAVRDAGGRVSDVAPVVDARITLSDNASQFLLVEEAHKGEDRQVWISSWKRPAAVGPPAGSALTLGKKLVWEQEEPILDVSILGTGILVLSPSRLSLQGGSGTQSLPITPPRPWPRDLRGHLRVNGGGFKAYLPGVACSGTVEPSLTMECHPSDEPWTLDEGPRGVLLANFVAGRNYFDGRVFAASGIRKTLAPFFSAASTEENGRTYWLLAMLDGRTQILDAALEPVGNIAVLGQRPRGHRNPLRQRLTDSGNQTGRGTGARCRARLPTGKPDARSTLRPSGTAGAGHSVLEPGRQRGARGSEQPRQWPLPGIRDYGELW